MDRLSDFLSELLNKRDLMHFHSWTGKRGATLIWTPRVGITIPLFANHENQEYYETT